jgi:aspartyl-tRNA(Asn)/glutamyl-tRNA(Gln) amidotransferase subunit C
MIEIKDVEKLAELSRIAISDSEKESFRKEIDSILGYVEQIKKVGATLNDEQSALMQPGLVRNIFRMDENAHESALYTEDLLANALQRQGNYFKVKKIL